ncbi:MAG TPA: 4-alpha-glucanotransferase, partial [Gemmatimonadales bacterium]|nr:4-alpha-glucanotransferase [Gemmatimonadales bacterium]
MNDPLRLAIGLHLHQPVGNFDSVFEQHLAEVYRPLLHEVIGGGCAPATLHLSGPLLDWLEQHDAGFLDELGRQVSEGAVELLLAGYDEPILAALPREDRLEQIARMREALQARFGVDAGGLWLTERVWEPDLAGDLHDAGVRYALVDDRHFLIAGFERAALYRPWRTEQGGRGLTLVPIDEQLRYLVPFRPPAELAAYLRTLREQAHGLAVLADDGEKFGGWPGTHEWVYQRGWLREFLGVLDELRSNGEIRLLTLSQTLAEVPARGPAYLPTASYREMEGWALPPDAARRLAALSAELGEERMQGADGSLIRGSHWR